MTKVKSAYSPLFAMTFPKRMKQKLNQTNHVRLALSNKLITQLIIDHPEIPPEIGIIGGSMIMQFIEEHPNIHSEAKIAGVTFDKESKTVNLQLINRFEEFFIHSESKETHQDIQLQANFPWTDEIVNCIKKQKP